MRRDRLLQNVDDILRSKRPTGVENQASTRLLVHQAQYTERTSVFGHVVDKVPTPHLVSMTGSAPFCSPCAPSPGLALALVNLKPFLVPYSLNPFRINFLT